MFEAAVEEGFGQGWSTINLADRRLQLERYRSRWDHFDGTAQETIDIPPVKIRICEKGYLIYIFQTNSNSTIRARVIRLPSTRNGVTKGEWVFNLEMLSPDDMVLGMTLEPELDLLVVIVSFDQQMCVLVFAFSTVGLTFSGSRRSRVNTLRLSDGQPHPTIPMFEPIRAEPGIGFLIMRPCVTRSRLAFVVVSLERPFHNASTFHVYDLWTGKIILVGFIRSPQPLTF